MEKSRKLIIKITNESIFFNAKDGISIEKTNIPINHLKFKYNRDIFWNTEMNSYCQKTKTLFLKVQDYSVQFDKDFFEKQVPKK
ncbi:MAG: hypothetical protein ACXITV_06350 [Luteibaculaceae bacterium]